MKDASGNSTAYRVEDDNSTRFVEEFDPTTYNGGTIYYSSGERVTRNGWIYSRRKNMKNPKFTKDQLDKLEYFYEGYKEEKREIGRVHYP